VFFHLVSDEEIFSSECSIAALEIAWETFRFVVLLVPSEMFRTCIGFSAITMVDRSPLSGFTDSASLGQLSAASW
jgi:hypothetical protein